MKKELELLDVVVVGAGALGNEVVWNLGQRGVRNILVVDPDVVEEKNLALARMFTADVIGQPKARVLSPRAFHGEIADLGWGELENADLIFSCVDRDSARLEIARISTRLGIPVCDGGLGVCGRVSYFPPGPDLKGPCFGCRLTAARRRELLSTWRSQAYPCVEPLTETARVTTLEQVRATGALQVETGLAGGPAVTTEVGKGSFTMSVNDGCPFHSPAELVPFAAGQSLSWEWPICLSASCQRCRHRWAPRIRRAKLKSCPQCGSEKILALECVDEMSEGIPEDIGLPANHRYTVTVAKS